MVVANPTTDTNRKLTSQSHNPMIAIQKIKAETVKSQCIPNLLPCRVHQDGPVNASPKYWNPQEGECELTLSSGA